MEQGSTYWDPEDVDEGAGADVDDVPVLVAIDDVVVELATNDSLTCA